MFPIVFCKFWSVSLIYFPLCLKLQYVAIFLIRMLSEFFKAFCIVLYDKLIVRNFLKIQFFCSFSFALIIIKEVIEFYHSLIIPSLMMDLPINWFNVLCRVCG